MHLDFNRLNRIFNVCCFPLISKLVLFRFDFHLLFIYYKSKNLEDGGGGGHII